MKDLFDQVSIRCSRLITRSYSTSFSLGIWCLQKKLRNPIYSIYGFVRFADEIVDTFHRHNQVVLLEKFRQHTYQAIEDGISLNPVLNAYQSTVREYQIPLQVTELFLKSMEMDLYIRKYDEHRFQQYLRGSAEAVALMCLRIFCHGKDRMYEQLRLEAMSLGAAFQKINFLRDLKADAVGLGRIYFPEMKSPDIDLSCKKKIENSIERDLVKGLKGIKKLPRSARFGVYVAYMYYLALFRKIRNTPPEKVLQTRIRIPNRLKATLLAYSFVKYQLNIL